MMNNLAPSSGRRRVRLIDPPDRNSVSLDPHFGKQTAEATKAKTITPEMLAYALPGGLGKLANPKWIYANHIRLVEDKILDMLRGIPVRLLVSMPPRHGKTYFLDRILAAWFLGRFPDKRVLLITNHTTLSRKQGRYARNILATHGPSVFGVRVADDTAAAGDWEIADHEGGMEAVGAGSVIQGKGADLLLLDDIVKGVQMANNAQILEDQWEWFNTDVMPRLEPGASAIATMTRWTSLDVIGRLEERMRDNPAAERWDIINLPALGEENDPLGRTVGEALFPQRYAKERLEVIRSGMDPYWWDALFRGSPSSQKGTVINIDWLKRYKECPPREICDFVIISLDSANKENELADYTVFGVWFVHAGAYYLVDVIRDRMTYPGLVEMANALYARWMPDYFLIEEAGNGLALIQQWQAENSSRPVVPITTGGEGKVMRMQAETREIQAGRVNIPYDDMCSWVVKYVEELRVFPKGRKDQADMTSQFLKFMRTQSSGVDMF
jgi:hypothetical protein